MINFDRVSEKIFSIIKGHNHDLIMYTEDGKETSIPSEGRRFFVKEPNYMVTLDDESKEIKFNKNSNLELKDIESLLKQFKNLAKSYMLNTQVKVFGKEIQPKDYAYQAKQYKDKEMNDVLEAKKENDEYVSEASLSRMRGTSRTSYQTLESVRLLVRHRAPVDEEVHGARSRNIHSIFLEKDGERFKFPHRYLAGARAMARHMYEGGKFHDDLGQKIVEMTGNLVKLKEFMRYARRNRLINEDTQDVVSTVKENMRDIKHNLRRLSGTKTYESAKAKLAERNTGVIEGDEVDSLQDMFTVRRFDERIGEILPLVNRLVTEKRNWKKRLQEASEKEFNIHKSEDLSEEEVLEFDNPIQKLGYRMQKLSERAVEESELSKFINRLGEKLVEGEELSTFEKKIAKNVLENVRVVEEEKEVEEGLDVIQHIAESIDRKLSKFTSNRIFYN